MSPQTLSSALGALRNAGSVFGLILAKGNEIIYRDASLPEHTLGELASVMDDMAFYFGEAGRSPDQLSFGFDGGNILILLQDEHRMMIFHHQADEVDFVGKAGKAFFKDYQMNLLADEWAPAITGPATASREATQRVAVRAGREG